MADGWQSVALLPVLEAGELQVWRINLAEATESEDIYQRHLSEEERNRADRLRAGQVRMQFLVARTCLRVLLGNILGLPAGRVPITLSAYGKPETAALDGKPIWFNVAHSRETILIAICREGRVGIDLEYLDRETDVLEVARNSLTGSEFGEIEKTRDPVLRRCRFFRCWTRKEAVVKADGRGLSLPLDSFEVPAMAPARWTPVQLPGGLGYTQPAKRPRTLFVSDLALGEGVAGAFAVETDGLRLRTFELPLNLILTAVLTV